MTEPDFRIHVVHESIDEHLAEELNAFWSRLGALQPEQARQRLTEVLCVLRDEDGEIVGINSAGLGKLADLGNQVFHIYRSLFDDVAGMPESWMQMLLRACETLDEQVAKGNGRGAIGLMVPIANQRIQKAWPEAVWPESGLVHAGFFGQGLQVRLRYYAGARIQAGEAA